MSSFLAISPSPSYEPSQHAVVTSKAKKKVKSRPKKGWSSKKKKKSPKKPEFDHIMAYADSYPTVDLVDEFTDTVKFDEASANDRILSDSMNDPVFHCDEDPPIPIGDFLLVSPSEQPPSDSLEATHSNNVDPLSTNSGINLDPDDNARRDHTKNDLLQFFLFEPRNQEGMKIPLNSSGDEQVATLLKKAMADMCSNRIGEMEFKKKNEWIINWRKLRYPNSESDRRAVVGSGRNVLDYNDVNYETSEIASASLPCGTWRKTCCSTDGPTLPRAKVSYGDATTANVVESSIIHDPTSKISPGRSQTNENSNNNKNDDSHNYNKTKEDRKITKNHTNTEESSKPETRQKSSAEVPSSVPERSVVGTSRKSSSRSGCVSVTSDTKRSTVKSTTLENLGKKSTDMPLIVSERSIDNQKSGNLSSRSHNSKNTTENNKRNTTKSTIPKTHKKRRHSQPQPNNKSTSRKNAHVNISEEKAASSYHNANDKPRDVEFSHNASTHQLKPIIPGGKRQNTSVRSQMPTSRIRSKTAKPVSPTTLIADELSSVPGSLEANQNSVESFSNGSSLTQSSTAVQREQSCAKFTSNVLHHTCKPQPQPAMGCCTSIKKEQELNSPSNCSLPYYQSTAFTNFGDHAFPKTPVCNRCTYPMRPQVHATCQHLTCPFPQHSPYIKFGCANDSPSNFNGRQLPACMPEKGKHASHHHSCQAPSIDNASRYCCETCGKSGHNQHPPMMPQTWQCDAHHYPGQTCCSQPPFMSDDTTKSVKCDCESCRDSGSLSLNQQGPFNSRKVQIGPQNSKPTCIQEATCKLARPPARVFKFECDCESSLNNDVGFPFQCNCTHRKAPCFPAAPNTSQVPSTNHMPRCFSKLSPDSGFSATSHSPGYSQGMCPSMTSQVCQRKECNSSGKRSHCPLSSVVQGCTAKVFKTETCENRSSRCTLSSGYDSRRSAYTMTSKTDEIDFHHVGSHPRNPASSSTGLSSVHHRKIPLDLSKIAVSLQDDPYHRAGVRTRITAKAAPQNIVRNTNKYHFPSTCDVPSQFDSKNSLQVNTLIGLPEWSTNSSRQPGPSTSRTFQPGYRQSGAGGERFKKSLDTIILSSADGEDQVDVTCIGHSSVGNSEWSSNRIQPGRPTNTVGRRIKESLEPMVISSDEDQPDENSDVIRNGHALLGKTRRSILTIDDPVVISSDDEETDGEFDVPRNRHSLPENSGHNVTIQPGQSSSSTAVKSRQSVNLVDQRYTGCLDSFVISSDDDQ